MLALSSPLYVDTESVDPPKIHANSVNHENVPVSQTLSEGKWDSEKHIRYYYFISICYAES